MTTRISTPLLSLLAPAAAVFFSPLALAQNVGTKATVTIALRLTEQIGGFQVTDVQVEKDEAKSITYSGVLNPIGFDAEMRKFNYFGFKNVITYRVPSEQLDETSNTSTYSYRVLTTAYGNAQFLADLVALGKIPAGSGTVAEAIRGYSLVAVQFPLVVEQSSSVEVSATDESSELPIDISEDDSAVYFFVEKSGSAPIYVGRTSDDSYSESSSSLPLLLTDYGRVEASTLIESSRTTYTRTTEDGETVFEANEPVETVVETYSGTADAYFRIQRGSGSVLGLSGLLTYGGRYDARIGLDMPGAANVNLSGSLGFYDEEYGDYSIDAVAAGTVRVSASRVVSDVSAYQSAISNF